MEEVGVEGGREVAAAVVDVVVVTAAEAMATEDMAVLPVTKVAGVEAVVAVAVRVAALGVVATVASEVGMVPGRGK